jgi:hypothetical protein
MIATFEVLMRGMLIFLNVKLTLDLYKTVVTRIIPDTVLAQSSLRKPNYNPAVFEGKY